MFKELIFFTKMVITTKNYKLSKIKQLIDLNGDLVNFDLTFSVKSTDGSNFEALVVTQEQIDSGEPLEYKKADGSISGSIVADKDLYQNYFLLLKSDNPVECEVKIDVNNVPQEQVLQQKQKIQEQMLYNESVQKENELNQQMLQQQRFENLSSVNDSEQVSSNSINWRLILLVGLILIGLGSVLVSSKFPNCAISRVLLTISSLENFCPGFVRISLKITLSLVNSFPLTLILLIVYCGPSYILSSRSMVSP